MGDLIRCVVCGSEPLLGGDNFGGRHIYCPNRDCPTAWGNDMGEAIDKWNARAPLTSTPQPNPQRYEGRG